MLHPLVLQSAVLALSGDRLQVVAAGSALNLVVSDADTWALLAISGGRPIDLMGEWDGHALKPLTAWGGEGGALLWQRSGA